MDDGPSICARRGSAKQPMEDGQRVEIVALIADKALQLSVRFAAYFLQHGLDSDEHSQRLLADPGLERGANVGQEVAKKRTRA